MIYGAIKLNMFRSRSRCIGGVFTERYRPFEFKFFLFIFRQDSKQTGVLLVMLACVSIFVLICVYCYECCSSPRYCVNVSNDSLVLLHYRVQMQSAIINNNNTARHPHHLCSVRDIKAPQDCFTFVFQFSQPNRIPAGPNKIQTKLIDLIQELIEMLTARGTPGNSFSDGADCVL